jgi:hypothetical protein
VGVKSVAVSLFEKSLLESLAQMEVDCETRGETLGEVVEERE